MNGIGDEVKKICLAVNFFNISRSDRIAVSIRDGLVQWPAMFEEARKNPFREFIGCYLIGGSKPFMIEIFR